MTVARKPYRPAVAGRTHVVASGHYLGSQAGFQVLEAGGNAVDAGVAIGLATGVLEGVHVSFAGVAPILVYLAEERKCITISGLGCWPAAASVEYFEKHHGGKIPPGVARTVVPAAPDAWITALEKFGTMSFAEVASFAIRYAKEGFAVYPYMANFVARNEADLRRYPSTQEIFLPGGQLPQVGDLFVQTDLAATIQYMADQETANRSKGRIEGLRAARDAFYRGDIASRMLAFHKEQGGLLTAEDLSSFKVGLEQPLLEHFPGFSVFTCGPWCQGPMLLQQLKLLDLDRLRGMEHNSPAYIHEVVEATKLSAADREAYYGDPRFVDVPMEDLLSDAYSQTRRRLMDPKRAAPGMPAPGGAKGRAWTGDTAYRKGPPPRDASLDESARDTTYLCVVDRWGNAFSATPSDGAGTAPIVPGTGFVVSPRGSQSRVDRAHASSVAPRKRPRLTPNPALAFKDGEWIMPFGTPGGDVQTQTMLQCLLNVLVFGFDVQSAVEVPRFASYSFPSSFAPNEYRPGVVRLESRFDQGTSRALEALGHKIEWWPDFSWESGSVCMIFNNLKTGIKSGGADPRLTAYAVGW